MTYLKRSKRPNRGVKGTVLIISALVLIFAIDYFFPVVFPTILYPITSLFWKGESSSAGLFASMGEMVASKYSLTKENQRLQEEISARDSGAMLLDTLRSENENLKALLGRNAKGTFVIGVILARPPAALYDTLVIDAGSSDGIKVGDKVYAEGDVLLGDIAEVSSHQSKVSLYSSPGRVTPVLFGTTTIAAEATGKGGGNFMTRLPAKTLISSGEIVTMPQIHAHTFGVVEDVTLDSSASLQTILFKTPVNVNQISFVEVDITK